MAESICEAFQSTGQAADGPGTGLSDAGPLRRPRSPPASASGCSWPAPCATAPPACSMCWTSRPSVCIPSNIVGLTGVMHDLVADGNSVILVDHDTQILEGSRLDHRNGPGGGRKGRPCHRAGHDCQPSRQTPASQIGPFLSGHGRNAGCGRAPQRRRCLQTGTIHLVHRRRSTPSSRWRWISPRGG